MRVSLVPMLAPLRVAALWLGLGPAAAVAQDSDFSEPDPQELFAETPEQLDALIWKRDRELLHTGDPLSISGLLDDEEALRAGTPALQRCEPTVAFVDQEALYERKRAMHEQRASFGIPIPKSRRSLPEVQREPAGPRSPASGDHTSSERPSDSLSMPLALGLVLAVLMIVVVVRMRRETA